MAGKKKDISENPQKWEDIPEIPKEDQPYPLPEGWKWVKLNDAAKIIMGQSPCGEDTTDDPKFTPLIGGASDMGLLFPEIKKYTKRPTKISQPDDVIVCVRATLGRPIFSDGVYCLGRGVAAIRPKIIDKSFLRYFLINFEQYLYDNATGSTFAQISSEKLANMPLPLPEIETQQPIVSHIESLFSKLDEATEKVQAVIDSHEAMKQTILHKAFSGELTRKWREENGVSLDSWGRTQLKEIIKVHSGQALTSKNMDLNGKIPVYGGNGIAGYHNKSNTKKGTIIIGRVGYYCGTVYKLDRDSWVTDNALIVEFNHTKILSDFLFLILSYMDLRKNDSSTAQPVISGNKIYPLNIIIPNIDEQKEMVNILYKIVNIHSKILNNTNRLIMKIKNIKQSILINAFRGYI